MADDDDGDDDDLFSHKKLKAAAVKTNGDTHKTEKKAAPAKKTPSTNKDEPDADVQEVKKPLKKSADEPKKKISVTREKSFDYYLHQLIAHTAKEPESDDVKFLLHDYEKLNTQRTNLKRSCNDLVHANSETVNSCVASLMEIAAAEKRTLYCVTRTTPKSKSKPFYQPEIFTTFELATAFKQNLATYYEKSRTKNPYVFEVVKFVPNLEDADAKQPECIHHVDVVKPWYLSIV